MKNIDFSFNGGFPLTQETLDYMQGRDIDILKSIVQMGVPVGSTDPIILSGCYYDSGTTSYGSGWIYKNGEVYYFAGGAVPALPAGAKCIIQDYTTTVVFEDATSHDVYIERKAVYGTGAGEFDLATTKRFHEEFGVKAAEDDFSTIAVAAAIGTAALPAAANGTLYYKKIHVPKMVQIRADIVLTNAQQIVGNPRYDDVCVLPAGYRPASTVPFKALVRYQLTNYITDLSDKDYIKDINCEVLADGTINMGFIEPLAGTTTYTVSFNLFIPLT